MEHENIIDFYLGRILMMLSIILGIHLQLAGTNYIGGGFQGGCIFGAIIITIISDQFTS